MQLYDYPRSGNCYKIRLLLSMLEVPYDCIPVDTTAGETLTHEFLKLNPRGQVPVLRDGDAVIWDSMAILVYLARRYGNASWLPTDALGEARVMQWLAVSENELLYGLARARAVHLFGRQFDLPQALADARQGLKALEVHLLEHQWLAAEQVTLADIACYPYVSLSHEAGIALDDYPHIRAWVERVRKLPGYVPMLSGT